MKTCTVAYNKKCVVIESGKMRLAVATDKGPRVVGCFIGKGSKENMFAVLPPEPVAKAANGYCFYGGHRLWHSPEDCPLCYEPDNDPVKIEELENGVEVSGAADPKTGMKKKMLIEPLSNGMFCLTHTLENCGIWPVEIAPWCLTMMAPGGMLVIPQGRHPKGFPYAPDRSIKFWAYTNMADYRLKLTDNYILLKNDPAATCPAKIGYNDMTGWVAYANNGQALVKYFEVDPDGNYPDEGCTVESYTCNVHTEVETLGVLETVEPGDCIQHVEYWQAVDGLGKIATEKDVEKKLVPYLLPAEECECECDEDCDCDDECCCGDEACDCHEKKSGKKARK